MDESKYKTTQRIYLSERTDGEEGVNTLLVMDAQTIKVQCKRTPPL